MRVTQGHHFSVRATGLLGAALADHLASRVDQHATYARVGVGPQQRGVCLLQRLLGERRVNVNSLHAQGVDVLAPRARLEATCCEDGQVEALSVPDAPGFVLALQWHPEYRALENPISMKLFDAFAAACRARMTARAAPLLHAAE